MKIRQPDFDRGAPAATERWTPASPPVPWSPANDWRGLPDADIEPLLQAETEAWRGDLFWDVRDSWQVIQPARRAGYLPGLVARDPTGRHQGWTCFFVDRRCLQVMIFVSSSGPATTRLVDLLLASPHAQSALEVSFFVRDGAPGLAASLEARAFETEDYRYLLADLTPGPAGGRAGRVGSCVTAQPSSTPAFVTPRRVCWPAPTRRPASCVCSRRTARWTSGATTSAISCTHATAAPSCRPPRWSRDRPAASWRAW